MSKKIRSCFSLRGLYVALCLSAFLLVVETQAQAQSALTRHVRQAVTERSGAVPEPRCPPLSPCASTLFCRCAIRQAWINSCKRSTILPALPTGTSSRCRSLPRGLVPARKIMTPWFTTLHRTALRWLAAPAMAWTCRSRARWRPSRAAFHVTHGYLPAPHGKPHILCSGPRAHGGPAVPAVAHLGFGQLFDPASHARQEERLREGPWHRSGSVVSHATTGSGPSASFLGSDMRAAYYGGTALTGAGQNLGLLEYDGTDLADLTTYFKNVGQTNNVPITLLSTDGTSTSCVYSSRAAATTPNRRST